MASAEWQSARAADPDPAALRKRVRAAAAPLLARALAIVDIGAQELAGEHHVYAPLAEDPLPWRVIGFEPQEDKIAASAARHPDGRVTLYPTFIGDGGEHTFHINNDDATSSLLPLNEPLTHTLADLDHLRTVHTARVATRRLDDVLAEVPAIDFLKLDIQGFELPVLQHAPAVLARTGVVHCEVGFMPIYAGQALFADVDRLLREHGFYLLDFHSLCRYPDTAGPRTRDRLGWGDAVYFREPETLDAPALLAQMLAALLVYGKPSAAAALARRHDALAGTHLAALFTQDTP
jgi:FkbM family methyltransferase